MNTYKRVIVSDEGTGWLRRGQLWLYRNNVVSYDDDLMTGDIAAIYDERGAFYGSGFFHAESHITVRILTRKKDEQVDAKLFRKRIEDAYRHRLVSMRANITDCRLIYGESDLLPGLIADRYDDVIVTQITSCGIQKRRDEIYTAMMDVLQEHGEKISGIYERNDLQARKKEGLELYKGWWKETDHEPYSVIDENGIRIRVDFVNGQKSGYFLDQKNNRLLVRGISKDMRVLDCFTHTGGFALNAAKGGAKAVTAVDVSASALQEAAVNAGLSGLEDAVSFVQDDVFDYLDRCEYDAFDIIILDPPAFTKSRKTVMKAYNGYKRINRKAMELLADGSYLVTCSCSRYMEMDLFERMLKEAALEAGVMLKLVSQTVQNGDHPMLWNMDETCYLKFYIFEIVRGYAYDR